MKISNNKATSPGGRLFAEVAFPIRSTQTFTYILPKRSKKDEWLGYRVVVPFRNQLMVGIIFEIKTSRPKYAVKPILEMPDQQPIWHTKQRSYLKWLANYYMVSLGDVVQMAIAGIRMLFQPMVDLLPSDELKEGSSPAAKKWLSLLAEEGPLAGTAFKQHYKHISDWKSLHQLVTMGMVSLVAPLSYIPTKQNHVILSEAYQTASALAGLKKSLAKKSKQRAIFQHYLATGYKENNSFVWLPLSHFHTGNFSKAAIETLVKKGVFLKAPKPLIKEVALDKAKRVALTVEEQSHYEKVLSLWEKKGVVLLWGKGVAENRDIGLSFFFSKLPKGKQGLYLVPKKDFTADWIKKVKARFGEEQLAFYDDSLRDRKKHLIWDEVRNNKVRWVIGTRSALFLPFQALDRMVISSAASKSYSLKEQSPVFHGRDVGIMLAHLHGASTLLTAPLPSLETYYNVKTNKYAAHYWPGKSLPHDALRIVVNREKIGQQPHPLSKSIRNEIKNVLSMKKAVIILHHRKGYATYNSCLACRWIAKCPHCKSSLTFHDTQQQLCCHFCTYAIPPYPACPACKNPALQQGGIGIAQLMDLLPTFFPDKKIISINNDAQAAAYVQSLKENTQPQAKIVVASPHLIKWFPLNKKSLVVIPDIDRWLRMRHFKAGEWCYQWLAQLASHAHMPERDMIWLQTSPYKGNLLKTWVNHIQFQEATQHYDKLLVERATYGYPPYTRRLKIILQHPNAALLYKIAVRLAAQLRPLVGNAIAGPTPEGRYYPNAPCVAALSFNISRKEAMACKQKCYDKVQQLQRKKPYAKVKINFIVDPTR